MKIIDLQAHEMEKFFLQTKVGKIQQKSGKIQQKKYCG
jgi:hypothetical protein